MFVLIYLRIHFHEVKRGERWDISPEKEMIHVPVHKHSVYAIPERFSFIWHLCRYVML